jgi:hypothetical protein
LSVVWHNHICLNSRLTLHPNHDGKGDGWMLIRGCGIGRAMTQTDTFLAAAAQLLGPRGLTCDPDLLAPWLTDWQGRYTGAAMGLASPADSAQLAQLMALAHEHGVALVPQGGIRG